MTRVQVMRGVLGWGNRKAGLEAYGPGGRWMKFANGDPCPPRNGVAGTDGDLLGDALERQGMHEGADLIVVAIPRSTNGDRDLVDRFTNAVTLLARVWFP